MAEETINKPPLTARQVAEQNPELDKLRQIAFGVNYLDDLDANRGTARFYSGFGMQPDYLNTAAGTEQAVAEAVAAEAEAAAAPVIETGSGESIQSQATGDLTDNTRFEQNLINQGAGVQRAPGQPVVAPGEVPVTQQEMDEFNFPALTQDSTAEEISRDLANQQAALPSDQNIMDEVALTGENTGILNTLLNVGSAVVSPVGTLVKKGLDAIPESQSQIEYDSYNTAQKKAIDTAYGTGGVMEGYNKVSALGEGALATVNERIANREANVSDPVNDKTLQELKTLRDTLDPQPVTYIQDPDTGDAKIAERIAAEERAANAPDAYTILGEEDTKQGVGPKYSDELDFRGDYLGTYGSPVQYDELDDIESQATALEEALGVSPTTYETPAPTYSYEGSDEQDRDQETVDAGTADIQDFADIAPSDSGSGGGGGCFVKGTPITMADGTTKPVEQVDLGDEIAEGGKVFAAGRFLTEELHDYEGIKVSGSHMVNEDDTWVRVRDSKKGKPLGDDEHTVYVFGAENRRILINGILFTDYFEIKEQDQLATIGNKYFDQWGVYAKNDDINNVNILNAS